MPNPSEQGFRDDVAPRRVQPLSGISVTMHPPDTNSVEREMDAGERSPRPPPSSASRDDGSGSGDSKGDGPRRKKSLTTSQAVELFKQLLIRETLTKKEAADGKGEGRSESGSGTHTRGRVYELKDGESPFDDDFHVVGDLDNDDTNKDSEAKNEHHRRMMSTDSGDIRVGLETSKDAPDELILDSAVVEGEDDSVEKAAAEAAAAAFDTDGIADEDRPIEDIDDEAARLEAQLEVARAMMADALKVRVGAGNKKGLSAEEAGIDANKERENEKQEEDGGDAKRTDESDLSRDGGEDAASAATEKPVEQEVSMESDLTNGISKKGIGKDGKWGPASIRTPNGAICNLKDHRYGQSSRGLLDIATRRTIL